MHGGCTAVWGIFLPVLVVVVDAVAVGAEDYAAFFNFFVGSGEAFAVYEFIHALFVRVIGVHVMEIEYGGV